MNEKRKKVIALIKKLDETVERMREKHPDTGFEITKRQESSGQTTYQVAACVEAEGYDDSFVGRMDFDDTYDELRDVMRRTISDAGMSGAVWYDDDTSDVMLENNVGDIPFYVYTARYVIEP